MPKHSQRRIGKKEVGRQNAECVRMFRADEHSRQGAGSPGPAGGGGEGFVTVTDREPVALLSHT